MKKKIALLMAMVMLFAVTTATTLAWLQAETDPVVNTFTVGDINITLDETNVEGTGRDTTNEYKMVPGQKYVKDPIVHVQPGSEPCWVFVKVAEENNDDDVIQYAVDDTTWALVDEDENIYVYGTATAPTTIDALAKTVPVVETLICQVHVSFSLASFIWKRNGLKFILPKERKGKVPVSWGTLGMICQG